MTRPVLPNRTARRLFLYHHHLCGRLGDGPVRRNVETLVNDLGFVQVDSINTVERAHHMILSARRRPYRPQHLKTLLERDRALFEHWTHDASVIPMAFYPYWRLKFERDRARLLGRWETWRRNGFAEKFDDVLERVARHGPTMARDVGTDESKSSGGWWDWHPSKTALEYLWRSGDLAVAGRDGFQKIFDLAENVIPEETRAQVLPDHEIIDWACNAALDRLGFATSGELAAFWALITPDEAKAWCRAQPTDNLITIDVENADGSVRAAHARPALLGLDPPDLPGRVRVLSPFDPALRDRNRAERLFGFHYRIEVFVPAPKRKFGYYVFPLLEQDRLIGRIDMKRQDQTLHIAALWPERGVRFGKGRLARLEAELSRVAAFAGCDGLDFAGDWLRAPV